MGLLTFLSSRFSGQDRDSVHGMSGEHISRFAILPSVGRELTLRYITSSAYQITNANGISPLLLAEARVFQGSRDAARSQPFLSSCNRRRSLGMLGTTDAAETLVAEKTPFVPVEEKRGAVADENYPIRRLSFTAALTPGSQRRVHQDRARKGLLRCLAFAGLVLLLVLGLSRAAME